MLDNVSEKRHLTSLGTLCLSNIAELAFRSFRGKRVIRRTANSIQLGWGTKLAQCCRISFDAVKSAHLTHLLSFSSIDTWRHPLFFAERSGGRPPYRLDQAIHLITRIRHSSPKISRLKVHTSSGGVSLHIERAPTCLYQHHSERRTLVISDHLINQVRPHDPLPHHGRRRG
jgi:hypothetical protein